MFFLLPRLDLKKKQQQNCISLKHSIPDFSDLQQPWTGKFKLINSAYWPSGLNAGVSKVVSVVMQHSFCFTTLEF